MFYDFHAHWNDSLAQNYPKWREEGLQGILLAAAQAGDWPALLLCRRQGLPGLKVALGLHPQFLPSEEEEAVVPLKRLDDAASSRRIDAIGEIGLDFSSEELPPKERQLFWLREQLLLARRHSLPVVLHLRKAWGEFLPLLKKMPGLTGVVHGFSGTPEVARQLLKESKLLISFGSPLLSPVAWKQSSVALFVPPERIAFDSDYPFRKGTDGKPFLPSHVALLLARYHRRARRVCAELAAADGMEFLKNAQERNWNLLFPAEQGTPEP